MNIAFKSENGYCPSWKHDGITYFLYEDYDGTWTLKSRKLGCVEKTRFKKVSPYAVLHRFFKNKKNVRYERKGYYDFWYWDGKIFGTDGEKIVVKYQDVFERPSFNSYLECLKDAKEYLQEKYADGQMSLFEL